MKITDLKIENFLTIGEANLSLEEKGLVLVQGENKDDPSADSNGAGKSSIPDALCWCLFGETARGVKGDAVINHIVKKNCKVSVTIREGDSFYLVTRHRKHKEGKNGLQLHTVKTEGGVTESVDLTLGTDKLTQVEVERILGCSYEVFRAAIYSGQESMADLPGMSDKQLKVLVEEAAGIDRLQSAYEVARQRMNAADKKLEAARAAFDAIVDDKIRLDGEFTNMKGKVEDWDFEQGVKIKRLTEEAKDETAEAKRRSDAFDHKAIEKLKTEDAELTKKLSGRAHEDRELERHTSEHAELTRKVATAQAMVKNESRDLRMAKGSLESIEDRIGEPCGECGKPYAEEDIEEARTLSKAALKKTVTRLKSAKAACEEAELNAESASKLLETYRASMTDVSAVVERQSVIRAEIKSLSEELDEIERLKESVKVKIAQIKEVKPEDNPYKALLEDLEKKQFEVAKKEGEQAEVVEKLEGELNLINDAVSVFGPAGVRAHILDTVTPYLNDRTAHYLGNLSDGNIAATWSTLSKTVKGDLREKFNIEVTNDKGANSFAGLSGGEKRKVRLAASMALQDMVASRASKPIDLYIADEVDHALDESGLERLMAILDEKARERGTVLVISHNELSDWIRDQVVVTKEGGVSTVSGVLV